MPMTLHQEAVRRNLLKQGVPPLLSPHEAHRMTGGKIGTKGDHLFGHGYTLEELVEETDGNLVHPKADDATCRHEESLPVPGLDGFESCMDCWTTRPVK